jgi:8-hydroxy-5-deazaflavin:NADPH oxidoreductase
MRIAIIGTGNVGGALARAWARAGHRIFLGVRNLQDQKVLALTAGGPLISAHTPAEAVRDAETVLFAIPPNAVRQVLDTLRDLKGKVLIDATNSVRVRAGEFASVADALRAWTGSVDVVKCFNSTGFNVMENPKFGAVAADMFMAGSSARAKEIARQLARDAGFAECYDLGGDERVALLESLAGIWIDLAMVQGQGREIAFKLLKR